MKLIDRPSPNFNNRPEEPVSILLLHYTGMETAAAALERLCDAAAQVSAHYTVDEDGTVFAHVAEGRRAWHAGVSFWDGDTDINGISVGIEIINPGHEFGYRPFPDEQISAVEALCLEILGRHPIPPHRVLGHSDVAPGRRQDPGELFPWEDFAKRGIGLWSGKTGNDDFDLPQTQQDLQRFGYDCPTSGVADAATVEVIFAFQRHFRPARVDGRIDAETAARAADLARQMPSR
jgi:N-acetylmuramoyl-L-alanine amidase